MSKKTSQPPYSITQNILRLVADISETIGRYTAIKESQITPQLRRENRIRTIQASLAIENNTLTLEQVTAVINGKRVLGHPKEIQEVRNAFSAYEAMENMKPVSIKDLLSAHKLLMGGLVDHPGSFRSSGVGIYRGKELIHMAPPAKRVPQLMNELLGWLKQTKEHPLVTSCVVHYEIEFIHPFVDGNGRMGRFWQTLVLRQWKSLLAWLPIETVIKNQQDNYYRMLAKADAQSDASPFVEFMLASLQQALQEAATSNQVSDQVSDQVILVLKALVKRPHGSSDLMAALGLSHPATFRKNYLNPALKGNWVERTEPDSPRSPTQRYRLTDKGRNWLQSR